MINRKQFLGMLIAIPAGIKAMFSKPEYTFTQGDTVPFITATHPYECKGLKNGATIYFNSKWSSDELGNDYYHYDTIAKYSSKGFGGKLKGQ